MKFQKQVFKDYTRNGVTAEFVYDIFAHSEDGKLSENYLSNPVFNGMVRGRSKGFIIETTNYNNGPYTWDLNEGTLFAAAAINKKLTDPKALADSDDHVIAGISAYKNTAESRIPKFASFSDVFPAIKLIEDKSEGRNVYELSGSWRDKKYKGVGVFEEVNNAIYKELEKKQADVVLTGLIPRNIVPGLSARISNDDKFETMVLADVHVVGMNSKNNEKPRLVALSISKTSDLRSIFDDLRQIGCKLMTPQDYLKEFEAIKAELTGKPSDKEPATEIEMIRRERSLATTANEVAAR